MPDWVMQLIGIVGASCGVYAGVKVDIAKAVVTANLAVESAKRAHERIDNLHK